MCRDDGNMNIIIIIIIIVIIIIIFTFAKYNPRELKIEYKWEGGYDHQSVLSAAGKLSYNKTALKCCTNTEILWYR